MSAAIVALAFLVVFASVIVSVVAVSALHQRGQEDQQTMVLMAASHADNTRLLLHAIVANHAGEFAALERVANEPAVQDARAEAMRRFDPRSDFLIDPQTGERMVPVGFEA